LAKADLGTDMVGEFADLQGLMGRYYATADGEVPEVTAAIQEHYSPLGPTDACPSAPVSVAVAMADKIITLTCFWSIDEKPTGSKDPFALRRAALSVVRLVLENGLRVNLIDLFELEKPIRTERGMVGFKSINWGSHGRSVRESWVNLLSFFADRLKVYLKDQGIKHDLIDAVFALEGQDDLVLIVSRINALKEFLETEDGANLLTAYKRAANILRIEEKKDKASYRGEANAKSFQDAEEHALHEAISASVPAALKAAEIEDFTRAMGELAKLRGPVDAFFDKVKVNAEDADVRKNRLLLLSQIVTALEQVADFSKLEG
jgi:glycyl-tRNA synthetase beta chain